MTRRDSLFASLHSNPKAKFVTRVVQFGSEPLFDNVLPHDQLAEQVTLAKANLSDLNIPVTVSELAYGYQERGGAQDVLDAIDSINIHMLPFFDQTASTGERRFRRVISASGLISLREQLTTRGHWCKRTCSGSSTMVTARRCIWTK